MKKRFKTLITSVFIALIALATICSPMAKYQISAIPYIAPTSGSPSPEEPLDPCPGISNEP